MKNVVLIDDEIEMTNLIEKFFKRFNEIKISKFNDSVKGLSFIKLHTVDLVVTDITMPKLDGIELLREIKGVKPNLHVIMMTAEASLNRVLKSHKYNAHDFITKPIDLLELEKKVKKMGFIKN